jgi:hypothetical protein
MSNFLQRNLLFMNHMDEKGRILNFAHRLKIPKNLVFDTCAKSFLEDCRE